MPVAMCAREGMMSANLVFGVALVLFAAGMGIVAGRRRK